MLAGRVDEMTACDYRLSFAKQLQKHTARSRFTSFLASRLFLDGHFLQGLLDLIRDLHRRIDRRTDLGAVS